MTTVHTDDSGIITVSGELNATMLPDVQRMVDDFFATGSRDIEVLTLDLSGVSSCDPSVLAAVRYARAVCADREVALRVKPNEAVRREMTREH
jgi:anti-anti-sigma factor